MNSFDQSLDHLLRKELTSKIETLSQTVTLGSCKTIESYRETVGEIRGLKTALQECDEIKKKLNEG